MATALVGPNNYPLIQKVYPTTWRFYWTTLEVGYLCNIRGYDTALGKIECIKNSRIIERIEKQQKFNENSMKIFFQNTTRRIRENSNATWSYTFAIITTNRLSSLHD